MKNKTLRRLLSFMMALILCFSFAIKPLEANALAIESWVIYALITYMTAIGFTFVATGGAQALYNAVEDKVNEYGNNVIDFYDIMRSNIKLVPPKNEPPQPDGQQFGNLFITAVGVEAMESFLSWLTSDGGWLGSQIETSNTATYTMVINGEERLYRTVYGLTEVGNGLFETEYYIDVVEIPQKYSEVTEGEKLFPSGWIKYKTYQYGYDAYMQGVDKSNNNSTVYKTLTYVYGSSATSKYRFYLLNKLNELGIEGGLNSVTGIALGYYTENTNDFGYSWFVTLDNGQLLYAFPCLSVARPADFTEFISDVLIETPENIPEIKPLPTLEGLFLESDTLKAESLEAFGDVVEALFADTGTIPKPDPQIIPDPGASPNPTPVPTPAPSPEIEDVGDLGLPTLGEAIFSKFPFSLPKDLKRISDILNAEPVTPKWEVDLYETLGDRIPFRGSTKLTIDLEEYEELGQISRWASVISFVVFLIIITKGVIRW